MKDVSKNTFPKIILTQTFYGNRSVNTKVNLITDCKIFKKYFPANTLRCILFLANLPKPLCYWPQIGTDKVSKIIVNFAIC